MGYCWPTSDDAWEWVTSTASPRIINQVISGTTNGEVEVTSGICYTGGWDYYIAALYLQLEWTYVGLATITNRFGHTFMRLWRIHAPGAFATHALRARPNLRAPGPPIIHLK
jgi:hypothetical protein